MPNIPRRGPPNGMLKPDRIHSPRGPQEPRQTFPSPAN